MSSVKVFCVLCDTFLLRKNLKAHLERCPHVLSSVARPEYCEAIPEAVCSSFPLSSPPMVGGACAPNRTRDTALSLFHSSWDTTPLTVSPLRKDAASVPSWWREVLVARGVAFLRRRLLLPLRMGVWAAQILPLRSKLCLVSLLLLVTFPRRKRTSILACSRWTPLSERTHPARGTTW